MTVRVERIRQLIKDTGSHVGSLCCLLGSVSVKLPGAKTGCWSVLLAARQELTVVLIICSSTAESRQQQKRGTVQEAQKIQPSK